MFRCQLSGEVSEKGEKPIFVVVEKRRKEYFGIRPRKKRFKKPGDESSNRRPYTPFSGESEKIGEGWEVVKELKVRKSALEKAGGKLEVKEVR